MRDLSTPLGRFKQHSGSAKQRGIDFHLTFEQWWAFWAPYWDRRGRGSNDLCMCRRGDAGAYEVGNVRIATNRENQQERSLEYRSTHAFKRYKPKTLSTGSASKDGSLDWARGRRSFDAYNETESS